MNINATCLIQMINFWITYTVLHKIFLASFASHISRKKMLRANLIDGLKDKQQLLVQLQNEKKSSLDSFREYLAKHYALQSTPLEKIPEQISIPESEKDMAALIMTEKDLIVQRIVSCIMK